MLVSSGRAICPLAVILASRRDRRIAPHMSAEAGEALVQARGGQRREPRVGRGAHGFAGAGQDWYSHKLGRRFPNGSKILLRLARARLH